MSQISVNNLTFYYDGSYDHIFENVSFQIDTDWKLGLIGRNGRGKTTFLNLLLGKYEYKGSISSSVPFDYFPFPVEDVGKMTIDIVDDVDKNYELWKVCRELNLLQADCEVLYRPFETLSNGERTKVMLAVLFSKESSFLLIDEPTNHLDMEAREVLATYLKKKKGFILVSHDRYFLDQCIDHVMSINKADIDVVQGNFSSWWENKNRQDAYELAENERLKGDIKRLTQAAKQKERWSNAVEKTKYQSGNKGGDINPGFSDKGYIGHKAAKMMKRAKVIEGRALDAVEEKKKLLKNIEEAEQLKLFPLRHHKDVLLRIEDLQIAYDGRKIFAPVSFEVRNGERVVLEGRNGCGKSSILKAILGDKISYTGKIELASKMKISYVSQDTSHLKGTLTEYAKERDLDESLFKALLRKLDFSRVQFERRMEEFSGGQKKKVLIAGSLCEQAHLYIWDEPLNFIDIFSRMQIEDLIETFKPAMIFVEHDRKFVEKIATKRLIDPIVKNSTIQIPQELV